MSLSMDALNRARSVMSTAYNDATKSMAVSLERISTGKRFSSASDDFAGYLKTVDLDTNSEKYFRYKTNLSEMGALLQEAVDTADNVMEDLKNMKAAWAESESYTAGTPEQLAAADLAAGYQDSIKEALKLTNSRGNKELSTSASWDTVVMAGGSTLTIKLDGETITDGTESTSAEDQTSIDNMTSYIGKLKAYKATVDSQYNYASNMYENTNSVKSAITGIDEAAELANYTDMDVRQQAAISMMAQANLSRSNIAKLYS